MGSHQLCLKWKDHQTNMLTGFEELLSTEALVDVTLACEGQCLRVHKVILSAFSPFFQKMLLDNPCQHPIVILNGIRYAELKTIVDFMYRGEVNINQDQLTALLETAESLKVKGLTVETGQTTKELNSFHESLPAEQSQNTTSISSTDEQKQDLLPIKRKRHNRLQHKLQVASSTGSGSESEDQASNIDISSVELAYVTPEGTQDSNTIYPTIVSTHSEANLISHSLFSEDIKQNDLNSQHNFISSQNTITNDESSPNCALDAKSENEKEIKTKCSHPYGNIEDSSPLLTQLLVQPRTSAPENSITCPERNSCDKPFLTDMPYTNSSPSDEQPSAVESIHIEENNDIKTLPHRSSPYNSGRKVAFEESSVHPRCPYCRKIYSRLSNLKRHMEIHMLDRKTYKCYICQKRFSWKTTLSSHLRRDHYVKVRTNWSHQD